MKYEEELSRECDLFQLSIATVELSSVIKLLAMSRNNEAEFHEYIAYAKQLQGGIREMELELKRKLRNKED